MRPATPAAEKEDELDGIEAVVAKHLEGLGRPALEQAYAEASGKIIPWRTFLRRLDRLVEEGRVRTNGEARATVYLPGPALILGDVADEAGYLPMSREGARVRALVRRPMLERPPLGYDSNFLGAYRPGDTWYLPKALRERLHNLGRTADADRPAGTYAREIFDRLLIDLAWASSHLEGNTYTRLDTQLLLEFGLQAEGKDATETLMILNHKAAIELLVEQADLVSFNGYTLSNLHAALSEGLLPNPYDEGRLRQGMVHITGSPYTPPAIPQQIEEWFDLLLSKADAITDPFEQAFFVMVHLPYLQPFVDVNKRTSRLAANIPLIKANLCPLSFVGVPPVAYVEGLLGVYELRRVDLLRDVFVAAYERSCAQYRVLRDAMGEPDALRLRYRTQLNAAVRETVASGDAPRADQLRIRAAAQGIPDTDVEAFAQMALSLLTMLHNGALARYGLRPSEYAAWRALYPPR